MEVSCRFEEEGERIPRPYKGSILKSAKREVIEPDAQNSSRSGDQMSLAARRDTVKARVRA